MMCSIILSHKAIVLAATVTAQHSYNENGGGFATPLLLPLLADAGMRGRGNGDGEGEVDVDVEQLP